MSLFPKLSKRQVLDLPLGAIRPNPGQPRKEFHPDELAELAQSIQQVGVLQPLSVRRTPTGWELVAGERRWRAARMAGLAEVPAVVIEADDRLAMELAMIENLQREDLNPMEEAQGFRVLVENYGMTQEQAAASVGKSRSAVSNSMRLLALSEPLRALVEDGKLTAGHGRAILPLSPTLREDAAAAIMKSGLSVRQTEQLVKQMLAKKDGEEKKKIEAKVPDYVAEAEHSLSTRLGRACHISRGRKKGKVEIEYYGVDDLNNLLEALGGLVN